MSIRWRYAGFFVAGCFFSGFVMFWIDTAIRHAEND
jgi:hypothetical protein